MLVELSMRSLFPIKIHTSIYVFALCLLAIGIPVSKFLMSLSQLILLGNWILEGNHKEKFKAFIKNKPALVLCSLLFLHFIGLIYTSDFKYAFNDIRIKAPLFVLPLILSTSKPLPEKYFHLVLKLLVASVFFSTLVSVAVLLGIYKKELNDIRGISIFISHIRFALLICMSFYSSVYFFKKSTTIINKLFLFLLILWWPFFLLIMQSLTGLGILVISAMCVGVFYSVRYKKGKYKLAILSAIVSTCIFIGFELYEMKKEVFIKTKEIDLSNLPEKTRHGHYYYHDQKSSLYTENGNLVWVYICYDELEPLWNKRSTLDFNSVDRKGNYLQVALVRFLASKGLTKDADGLNTLSNAEIRAIENGITNIKYMHMNKFKKRVYETLWEIDLYSKTGNANGHSLTQRFEYWKTACQIINDHFFIGVGTGDIADAFTLQYEKSNSLLEQKSRLRSHNQYLSITIAFGIIGLAWFLFSLFYPPIKLGMFSNFLFLSFFCIALFSFFTEDTLETQAGVTFYVFINSFLLFARENNYGSR